MPVSVDRFKRALAVCDAKAYITSINKRRFIISWEFSGTINYRCERCNHGMSVPVEDFQIESYGGKDGGMGHETLFDLKYEYPCDNCGHDIEVSFMASEYPQGFVSFIEDTSEGAEVLNDPEIIDIEEIESPIYLFPTQEIIVPDQRIITDISAINNTIPQLIKLIQEDSSYIHRISPREFEEIIAEIFRDKGFDVEITKKTRDGGKDIIAIHKHELGIGTQYFIECKRHKPTNKVGVGIVRQLYGVHTGRDGPNKSIIATTSTFTSGAIDFAENIVKSSWEMDLKDINDVLMWVNKYKKS